MNLQAKSKRFLHKVALSHCLSYCSVAVINQHNQETFDLGLAYSFIGLVHDHHGGKLGGRPGMHARMVLQH